MNRMTARELVIQLCFAASANGQKPEDTLEHFFDKEHYSSLAEENELYGEYPDEKSMNYISSLFSLIEENKSELDGFIERYSDGWKPERISKTALAVLRCAICEVLYMDDVPNAAAINAAVELDKGYDEDSTVSFVNGVLGGFMRGENLVESDKQ